MISWNKLPIIIFCLFGFNIFANAQMVNYYKLIKTNINNTISTNVSGGQFICIYDKVCFDCDKYGTGVGNGQLLFNNNMNGNLIFVGESFFGKDTYYKFSPDYGKLNIITPTGDIYAYVKSNSNSATTSTLVKKAQKREAASYDYENSQQHHNYNQSISSGSTTNSSPKSSTIRYKCAYCKGGRIEKNDNAPATFGINRPKQRCNECGKWYDPNVFNHYHIQCHHCGGSGFAK